MNSAPRIIAPLSFVLDFAAQQYGMFSSPNMLDIHNKNIAAFSPQPYFIAGFFFPQQLVQLVWLWRLCRGDGTTERALMEKFAWVYSLGNFCIGCKSVALVQRNMGEMDRFSPTCIGMLTCSFLCEVEQLGCFTGTPTTLQPPISLSS